VAPLILFPAIDIKDGRCVRLLRGDMTTSTVYNDDPAAQAAHFQAMGFEWLHVVDLDAAFSRSTANHPVVSRLLAAVKIPVQLGGGIRDLAAVETWLAAGGSRIVLGTSALRDPDFIRQACRHYPGRIAVGIDARKGRVAVEGWAKTSEISAVELARRFEDSGVAAIIHTDIERDGALTGLNLEATLELARAIAIPVIVSGGLASLGDIRRLLAPECVSRIAGAITGRALYDGRLDGKEALRLIRRAKDEVAC
jgi:phosphoribosylformimino-5-aminoimidazole carboxamide ribotide isomerase